MRLAWLAIAACACGSKDPAKDSPEQGKPAKDESAQVMVVLNEMMVREEQYRLENGAYLATGASEDAVHPGKGAAFEPLPEAWTKLRIKLSAVKTACGFVAITSAPGPIAKQAGFAAPERAWFYIVARCPEIAYFVSSLDNTVRKVAN